jgi:hypothetical protein
MVSYRLNKIGYSIYIFLLATIPLIPTFLIWRFLNPTGFTKNLIMLLVSMVLYIVFAVMELFIVAVLT